jgi:hypothetical protein
MIKSNRLLREFGNKYRIIYVKFRDEQLQHIYSDAVFYTRFGKILKNGFEIQGLRCRLLAASASQLREGTAAFIVGDESVVNTIRNYFIPGGEQEFTNIAKYVSRLGLFCTADYPLNKLSTFIVEDDRKTSDDKKTLTDGAGRLSKECMETIIRQGPSKFYTFGIPSAIQIRHGGSKGVLSIDSNLKGNDVYMSKSMVKCKSPHDTKY